MFRITRNFFCLVCLIVSVDRVISLINDSQAIQDFLSNYNKLMHKELNNYAEAMWNYLTNLTDYNKQLQTNADSKSSKFKLEAARNASKFDLSVMSQLDREQFARIMKIGTAAQTNETKVMRLSEIKSDMVDAFNAAEVCLNKTHCDSDLSRGKDIKQLYSEYVELSNEAVRISGYADMGAFWRSSYKTPTFEEDIRELYDQLRPLYEQLHAYLRRKLKAIYGNNRFPSTGHIPAHLFGNIDDSLWKELMPYPDKPVFDVKEEMVKQNYTALKMFQMADDFFQSLGLIPLPPEFWNKSMLEKPNDGRSVQCVPASMNLFNGTDFRITQCTEVNMYYLSATHHEMGHIQTFLQYSNQPIVFKEGANPGFHEAIGDVISLSVETPEHMHSIGLLKTILNDTESDINFLMTMAIKKFKTLSFTYMIEQWRWKVFRGEITPDKYNEEWWNLQCCYKGEFPPVKRTSDNFDPGSIFHIIGDIPVIRYFVSNVIQFQFHKALCDAAGHTGPLHRCDIYNSKAAGKKLSDVLKLGSSVPWTVAMHNLTGQSHMDARPFMEYFKPLMEYLKSQNGDDYGWEPQCPPFPVDEVMKVSESKSVVEPGQRCHLPADIIFLVDTSSTVWITDFNRHVKKFLKDMIVSFNVGPGPSDKRVGVLLFSNETYLQFHLNGYQETTYSLTDRIRSPIQTVKEKLCAVDSMRHRGGLTYTHKALEYAASEMLKPENGARPAVPKIVIVVTFGMPFDIKKTMKAAKSLKDKGVDIFSVGIGSRVSSNELKALTSSQSEQFVFEAADFRTLDSIKNRLETSICELLIATTTESHTTTTTTTTSTTVPTTTKKSTTTSSTTNGSSTTTATTNGSSTTTATTNGSSTTTATTNGSSTTTATTNASFTTTATTNGSSTTSSTTNGSSTTTATTNGSSTTTATINESSTTTATTNESSTTTATTNGSSTTTATTICGDKPADIYFLLDSSNSIWIVHFQNYVLPFVKDLVSSFHISPSHTRIGLVTFSNNVTHEFNLSTFADHKTLLEKLQKEHIEYLSGNWTVTGKAIQYVTDVGFGPDHARDGVVQIIITVTDGMSQDPHYTARAAAEAKKKGIIMFVIGVGSIIDDTELSDISSDPDTDFKFHVDDFTDMSSIKLRIANQICAIIDLKDESIKKCSRMSINIMFLYEYINHVSSFNYIDNLIDKFIEKAARISQNVNIGVLTQNCIGDGVKLSKVARFREDIDKVRQCYSKGYLGLMMKLKQSVFDNVPIENRKVAVLVVDKRTRNLESLETEIHQLKEMNVEIFVVTIGGVKREVIKKLTSAPYSDHIIEVKNEIGFKDTNMDVLNMVCGLNFEKETKE